MLRCGGGESPSSSEASVPVALVAGQGGTASVPVGTEVVPAPTFTVLGGRGNAIAGIPVTIRVASGGGLLVGAPTLSGQGATPIGTWTLGTFAGVNTVVVTSPRLPSVQLVIAANGVPGPPAQIARYVGDGQSADVATPVDTLPAVVVRDAYLNPVRGVPVTFVPTEGGGTVTGGVKSTDTLGLASPDAWILGPTPGVNTLSASAAGLSGTGSSVTFTAIAVSDTGVLAPRPVVKANPQLLYMHYMPWFEDTLSSGSGRWGIHWTMANRNPSLILPNGQRQIASFYYPLIGPYASSDPDVIDYHLLLMKYAGIDGVLVDGYSTHAVYDYPLNRRNADSLFAHTTGAGLQFATVYEDAGLSNVKAIAGTDLVPAAQQDFAYLQANYFARSNYIKINGRPLVLDFGPISLVMPAQWEQVFAALNPRPYFLSLWGHGDRTGAAGSGEYAWVSLTLAGLRDFYLNRGPTLPTVFGAAYPGFRDFYTDGGWPDCCEFTIPHNGTTTLREALDLSISSALKYVQLVTWNDFGEGTMIEPTVEFGYDFLVTIQRHASVPYTVKELELVYKWFLLRKKYATDAEKMSRLKQAYYYLVSLRVTKASAILNVMN
jgi:hypothetical protein